jgi:hypothetical protein
MPTKKDSASGRFVEAVKKDVHESVDLYFRPLKVLADEFTKASTTRQKRRPSPAR